jgi:hypothetical protein
MCVYIYTPYTCVAGFAGYFGAYSAYPMGLPLPCMLAKICNPHVYGALYRCYYDLRPLVMLQII